MAHAAEDLGLFSHFLILLGTAVITAPLARRLGLSAIVGYLIAGVAIGPWGLTAFDDPERVLNVAELGVVMLLFLIGLELKFSRLLDMRRAIFGLGAAQLTVTAVVLGALAVPFFGLSWRGAVFGGLALAMSSTAIALQVLDERGELQTVYGQRAFAVLLFQDIAVVPLLAVLPLLAPVHVDHGGLAEGLKSFGLGTVAIAAVVLAGRYLLNPVFRLLANAGAREAMTAAALLVVLGAAITMRAAGMSMALGAFLAGLMLAESNFRHQLEADIEPFRGLLLAVFFMSVGMSIDLSVVGANLTALVAAAIGVTLLKAAIVSALYRVTCEQPADAVRAGAVLTAASEFAFVLLPLGISIGVLTTAEASLLAALAAVTMLMGPPVSALTERVLERIRGADEEQPAEDFSDARGSVLIVGFGRFGQIVSQCLLAKGVDVTIIDNDVEMIQSASRFGFKIYYGDGRRLDVLRAAGAVRARVIAVCVDDQASATQIVEVVKAEFVGGRLYVRTYDRRHTLELLTKGVDYEIRETFESALIFGGAALRALGVHPEAAQSIVDDVRRRDQERLALQQVGGMYAGIDVLHGRRIEPEPLTGPRRAARPLNPDAEEVISRESELSG
jgi:monovalent cation:proton antiporter-2 (CPA2) family protein